MPITPNKLTKIFTPKVTTIRRRLKTNGVSNPKVNPLVKMSWRNPDGIKRPNNSPRYPPTIPPKRIVKRVTPAPLDTLFSRFKFCDRWALKLGYEAFEWPLGRPAARLLFCFSPLQWRGL